MAAIVITNEFCRINGVDLSDHLTKAELQINTNAVNATAMSAAGWEAVLGGLKNWQVSLDIQQDYAAAKTDATIWPLVSTLVTVELKPVNAATSATNPLYSGTVLVSDYKPIVGSVGELSVVSFTWTGSGAPTRVTV